MDIENQLQSFFEKSFGEKVISITAIKSHASKRSFCRIVGKSAKAVGIYTPELKEHIAFSYLTRIFTNEKLPVPTLFSANEDQKLTLVEDLGDESLFDKIYEEENQKISKNCEGYFLEILTILPNLQVKAGSKIDYSKCFPKAEFDRNNIASDIQLFFDEFVLRKNIHFNKEFMKKEITDFTDFLSGVKSQYFMYRDLQSRNIMIKDGHIKLIDYQGGRKGPLQYDIASLLFQSRIDMPLDMKDRLIKAYIVQLKKFIPLKEGDFYKYLDGFVLLRLMQALGTYGRVGIGEGKEYFRESVPYALKKIRALLSNSKIISKDGVLEELFMELCRDI